MRVTGTATVAGGLSISGGLASFGATAQAIGGPVTLSGGTLSEASGKTLTLSGPVAWSGGDVAGLAYIRDSSRARRRHDQELGERRHHRWPRTTSRCWAPIAAVGR